MKEYNENLKKLLSGGIDRFSYSNNIEAINEYKFVRFDYNYDFFKENDQIIYIKLKIPIVIANGSEISLPHSIERTLSLKEENNGNKTK